MKIAFAGAQSSGKTTLLKMMKEDPMFKDLEFCENITRKVQAEGYSINENSNKNTQFRIADSHKEVIQHENFVADRSMIDCYVYSQYLADHDKLDLHDLFELFCIMDELLPQYDYIFYVKPEFGLADDGVRSADQDFQDEIAGIFEWIMPHAAECTDVYLLEGESTERFKQLKEILKGGN